MNGIIDVELWRVGSLEKTMKVTVEDCVGVHLRTIDQIDTIEKIHHMHCEPLVKVLVSRQQYCSLQIKTRVERCSRFLMPKD